MAYPRSLCFSMKFFTYPLYNTDKCVLDPPNPGQASILRKEFAHEPEVLVKYEMESLHKQDVHMELAKYLKTKNLTVDVWDADSLIHYGYIRVPLSRLMR
jgi:hypothetical protein